MLWRRTKVVFGRGYMHATKCPRNENTCTTCPYYWTSFWIRDFVFRGPNFYRQIWASVHAIPLGQTQIWPAFQVCAGRPKARSLPVFSRFINETPLWAKFGEIPHSSVKLRHPPAKKGFAGRLKNVNGPRTAKKGLSAEILRVFPKSRWGTAWYTTALSYRSHHHTPGSPGWSRGRCTSWYKPYTAVQPYSATST